MRKADGLGARLGGVAKARYVDAMFERIVPRYDLMNSMMTFGRDRAWRSATIQAAGIRPKGIALDLATGTGDLAIGMALSAREPNVVGADFCHEMLRAAARKGRAAQLDSRVRWVLADAMKLPFPDESFDAATMGFALRNVSDIPLALSEVHRVLRPGTRFANLELTPPKPGPLARLFRLYFYRMVPLLGGLISGDLEAYTYLPHSLTHFPKAGRLALMMQDSGFNEVVYRFLALGTIAIHIGTKA